MGLLLRSDRKWQIDPLEIHTLERYLREQDASSAEPLSRDAFLGYLQWFTQEKGITIIPELVRSLRREGDGFLATLGSGRAGAHAPLSIGLTREMARANLSSSSRGIP